ncbi:fatty acid desaturase family protein [Chryseobacterium sp. MFBS3-17]|uniref:fatty acid desaturase family protein n=1 Tax=Chryseobacterium sp. MFBS3-17 TaxID=2886689 RepID=UPI001D0E1E9F|nr:fatty acid desaturase [Chryseobacterium sp. MFBS3-17]MCC2589547.1 fatty acid desaturase [Chryseobacterium sp. MFBS3-17]
MIVKKPSYQKIQEETTLFNELRKRVNSRVEAINDNRDWSVRIKAILLPLLYFGFYALAVYYRSNAYLYVAGFVLMGITLVLIYLNLIHEAAHNNIFKNKKWNEAVLSIFDFVGANSYIWKKRHIVSHHAYPNVDGWDTDIEQSGVLKIYPHVEAKGIQKIQHRIFFLIYPLYLFNWMFIRDFRDFFDRNRIIQKTQGQIPVTEKVKMVLFKAFYFFYQIVVPVLFFGVSWQLALGAWFLQVVVASVFALFVLLPLHPLPENDFPLLDEENGLPYSWIRHQFEVTNDLSNNNWFIRHILGAFNFHVAHHLFPNYSYVYYDEITDEVKKFAAEHHFNYKQFPITVALGKHYQLLKTNATSIHEVMEETM